ncbi:MAG TPA: NnrS family protein, partial [Methylophaga sp.]|nr:NnrS family protein [Methylophaga sp.]
PSMLTVFVDLLFFPLAALFLFIPLLIRNQSRNYFAVLGLLLLMFCNGMSHFAVLNDEPIMQSQALFSAVLLITVMMAIIGGRVIPMFTANTTEIPAKPRQKWLDRMALGLLWALLFLSLLAVSWQAPDVLLSLIYGIAAVLLGWRCAGWRFFSTFKHPLLWSLQLGYWWIVIGLLLFSGHHAGFEIPASVAMHSLTAGAMGTLILSMMSRVSLGHTGRPLVASRLISISLVMITLTALLRVFGVWFLAPIYQHIILLSVVFWTVAYGLFLIKYTPILINPRADGKEG